MDRHLIETMTGRPPAWIREFKRFFVNAAHEMGFVREWRCRNAACSATTPERKVVNTSNQSANRTTGVSEATAGDSLPARLMAQYGSTVGFYIGAPLFIAFCFTWISAGQVAQHLPRDLAFVYWAGLFVPKWFALDLATRIVHQLTRRWTPPVWLCALCGGALGSIAYKPIAVFYMEQFTAAFGPYLPEGFAFIGIEPVYPTSMTDVGTLLAQNGVSISFWIFGVVAFVRLWQTPRYLVVATPTPAAPTLAEAEVSQSTRIPIFMQRTRGLAQAKLLALQAEDHYVRVITDRGDDLVLYRFSDALEELRAHPGFRVHRSYWVAREAVQAVQTENKNHVAILSNGLRVPISRANIGLLRAEGLIVS
jgi:hypothetical protein